MNKEGAIVETAYEVVKIVESDYSGKDDIVLTLEKDEYIRKSAQLDANCYMQYGELTNEFLFNYRDKHLVFLSNEKRALLGFAVRLIAGKLYVRDVIPSLSENIRIGEEIVRIDQNAVADILKKRPALNMEIDIGEFGWGHILKKSNEIEFLGKNGIRTIATNELQVEKADFSRPYIIEQYGDGVVLLTIDDFLDYKAMVDLVDCYDNNYSKSSTLIIDVRRNSGGFDSVWQPLLPLIFPPSANVTVHNHSHLITERNLINRTTEISKFLTKNDDPFIRDHLALLKKYKGDEGWVMWGDAQQEHRIEGRDKPERVAILTDSYCGSSGEQFVLIAKQSDKVVTIGRSTFGCLDYSNVAYQRFDSVGFTLQYPTSRSSAIDEQIRIDINGILPDVYVPFTVESFSSDMDLHCATKWVDELL